VLPQLRACMGRPCKLLRLRSESRSICPQSQGPPGNSDPRNDDILLLGCRVEGQSQGPPGNSDPRNRFRVCASPCRQWLRATHVRECVQSHQGICSRSQTHKPLFKVSVEGGDVLSMVRCTRARATEVAVVGWDTCLIVQCAEGHWLVRAHAVPAGRSLQRHQQRVSLEPNAQQPGLTHSLP
jgi:hypothetical protein